ncbi:hypothetical protein MCEZE4_00001 [Burkholderiaceae bacterium]
MPETCCQVRAPKSQDGLGLFSSLGVGDDVDSASEGTTTARLLVLKVWFVFVPITPSPIKLIFEFGIDPEIVELRFMGVGVGVGVGALVG